MDVLIGFQITVPHPPLPRHFRLEDAPDITPNRKNNTHGTDGLQWKDAWSVLRL